MQTSELSVRRWMLAFVFSAYLPRPFSSAPASTQFFADFASPFCCKSCSLLCVRRLACSRARSGQHCFVSPALLGRGRVRGTGCFPCAATPSLSFNSRTIRSAVFFPQAADFRNRCDIRIHYRALKLAYAHLHSTLQRQLSARFRKRLLTSNRKRRARLQS